MRKHEDHLNSLPDDICPACNGADRKAKPGCNSCNGVGHKRPIQTWYKLSRDKLNAFIAFLVNCGGFTIH